MKMTHPSVRSVLTHLVAFLAIPAVHAGTVTWNNAAGGNWSLGANWTGGTGTGGIPGTADDVTFLDPGTGSFTTNDINFTIDSLTYGQDNGFTNTTIIATNLTLQINDTSATPNALYVGSTTANIGASTLVPVIIAGPGALNLNGSGSGALVVRQGWTAATGTHTATLDLSGLNTLTANLGNLYVGQATSGQTVNGVSVNRPSGTLLLAKTNNLVFSGSAPQVVVQDSAVNANGGTVSLLELGQVTQLWADQFRLGGQKGNGTVEFNPNFSTPTLQLRNTDGVSPITLLDCGDNSFASSGNNTVSVVDFSLGSVDALVATVYLAKGNPGPSTGTCTGTLNLGAGTFAVTTAMIVGYQIATGASGAVTATVNVINNNAFATGPTLAVGGTLTLAQTNASSSATPGAVTGTLNVTSGTVAANSIVAGGGASAISLSASTLTITNTAGTLAAPIKTLSISDSTLNLPAANAGAVLVASNLTAGGSASTINITAVPPVSSYPATFTLIAYQTGDTGGGNFVLGSLPAASPSYKGTIVDTGNGVVSLQLTAGPSAVLSLLWTGASGNTWDSTTFNWLYTTYATNFFNGATCLFNDTSTQTNVNLAQPLSPGSVTVANTNKLYTFNGTGNIAGAALLAKQGPGTLILDNPGVDNFSAVTISGLLQIGAGDTNGGLSALTIADNGALVVNRIDTVGLSSAISGTGSVTNSGSGTLILSGSNSYSGPTVLAGGTLIINGASTGTGAITTSAGTILAGIGTVNGAVTVGGQFIPGPLGGTGGVFTASNGLTMAAGSGLTFDLSPTDASSIGSATIAVTGNLVLHSNQITVNFSGTPEQGFSYPVITYTGKLTGSFNPVIAGTHFAAVVDTNSSPGTVLVTITGASGANLDWSSTSDTTWNSVTTNWLNLQTVLPSVFLTGDNVLLDDSPGVATTLTIAAGTGVSPAVLSNNSSFNTFTISGAGQIRGSTSILKTGSSVLTIATANTFTGSVEVQQGVLATANASALGASSGTLVDSGATLDVDGQSLGGAVITASGAGANGTGAIYNSGGTQAQAFRQLILDGNTTIGGVGAWGLNNGGGTASLSTGGNAYNLTKVGANEITFDNLTTFDTALANIDIQQGILQFEGLTPDMGDPSATNIVEYGAQLAFASGSVTWSKNFLFIGDGLDTTVSIGTSANPVLAGNVQLSGDCVFNVGGIGLTISGIISSNGGIIKNGTAPMTLATNNTYTSDTIINTGTLLLSTNGSIAASTNIVIGSGTTLDASQRSDSTLTLTSVQTLQGNGTVNGSLIGGPGSVISPGQSSVGALTVTNTVTLSGVCSMDLDQANATNDVLACNSTMKYGGVLDLNYVTGAPATGSSFKLFQAKNYSGSFSSISPATPGPGQTWDVSQLGTSGTIRVSSGTAPRFGGITVSGTNVVVSGSNGIAAGNYYLLTSTNVALALPSWTRIATNAFDGSGNFKFTNNISPSVPRRFFLLELP
jgi:autotransporter-associated beta strand protein